MGGKYTLGWGNKALSASIVGGGERKRPVIISVRVSAAPKLSEIYMCELYLMKGIKLRITTYIIIRQQSI